MSRNIEPNAALGMEAKCKEKDPSEKQEANSKHTAEQVVLLSPTVTRCNYDVSRENVIVSVAPVDNYPKESDTVVQQQHHDLWQHPGVESEESNPMKKLALFGVTSSRPKFRSNMPMLPAKKAYLASSDNMTSSAPSKEEAAPTAEVPPRKRKHNYEDVQRLELEENQRKREIRLERNRKTAKARREKKHTETEEKRQKIAKIVLENDFLRQSLRSRYQELSDAGVNEDTMKRAISPPSTIKQKMETKIQERNDLLGVVQNNARKKKDGMLLSRGSSFLDTTSPPVYSPSVEGVPAGGGEPQQMLLRPEVRAPHQDPFTSIDHHKQSIHVHQLLGTGLQQQKERQPRHDTLLASHLVRGQQPHFSPVNQPFEPYCGQDHQRLDDGVFSVPQQQARHQHQIGALERSRRQKIENNNDQKKQSFDCHGRLEGKRDETRLLQGFGQQEGSSLQQHPTSFHGLNHKQNLKQLGEQIPKVGGNQICATNQSQQEIIEENMDGILQQEQGIFDCLQQPQQHEWFRRQMQRDAGLRAQIKHQQDPLRLQEHLRYGGESAQNLSHENNLQIDVKEVDRSSMLNTAGTASLIRRQEELQGQHQWDTCIKEHEQHIDQEQLQERAPEQIMGLQRQGHPVSEDDRVRIERVKMATVLNKELQGQHQWDTCIKEHEQHTDQEQLQERAPEQIIGLQRQGHPISEDDRVRIERVKMATVLNRSLLAGCYHDHQPHDLDTNHQHLGICDVEVEQSPVPRQQDQHQQDVDLSNIERQQFRDFFQRQIEELAREEDEYGCIEQQHQH